MFQFHYGLIKRSVRSALNRRRDKFQFHYGLIKRAKVLSDVTFPVEFQFHYGLIKRNEGYPWQASVGIVSIPLWSD